MKKLLSTVMALFLTASLTGCGSSSAPKPSSAPDESGKASAAPETDKQETPAPASKSPKDQVYKVGDTITTDDFEFTVTDARIVDSISITMDETFLSEGEAGKANNYQYLIYNAEFRYIGSTADSFSAPVFSERCGLGDKTYYNTEFIHAFRKPGEDWRVTVYTSLFAGIPEVRAFDSSEKVTLEPSDQTYQARSVVMVNRENAANGPIKIEVEGYMFEIRE